MNTKLELNKRHKTTVGIQLINASGEVFSQVTGPLGVDPRFPEKWLVSSGNNYVIFAYEDVRDIHNDIIKIRIK